MHALAHFPSLERERERTVPAVDARGGRYRLRFRYWVNNQSRMYVLEGCQPNDVRPSRATFSPSRLHRVDKCSAGHAWKTPCVSRLRLTHCVNHLIIHSPSGLLCRS